METKWRIVLMVLEICSGAWAASPLVKQVPDGSDAEVSCRVTEYGTSVVWFRVVDGSVTEYMASVTPVNPTVRRYGPGFPLRLDTSRLSSNILILKNFRGSADAGIYSCASFSKDMKFGPITRLQAVKVEKPAPPPVKATPPTEPRPLPTSPASSACPTPSAAADPTHCSLLILAPLAGGCGLLLLVLLCTILYCNSVRTRRCPHHYKRKPRAAPGKHFKTNV